MYFDVLNDIVSEYHNTYQKTIKMKPMNVKNDSFAEYNEESNEKDPKLKVGDAFSKGYAPNWSKEIFVVNKKILYLGHM